MIKTVIGLDVGHSRVKVSVANARDPGARKEFSFPTLVSAWQQFNDAEASRRAEADTVSVDEKRYFVGNTVLLQDNPQAFVGVHFDWFEKMPTQYSALTKAAFNKARPFIDQGSGEIIVVAGLPAQATKEHRELVKGMTAKHIQPQMVFGETLKVLINSQANAPIFHMLFHENGAFNPDFRKENATVQKEIDGEIHEKEVMASTFGVIEVGHLTTDYTILAGLVGIENATTSTSGVFKAFELLQKELRNKGLSSDLGSVSDALIEKTLDGVDVSNIVANACANLIQETITTAKEAFSNRRLDGILVAGGGAAIVFPAIQKEFAKAQLIKKSRFAVAEGYVRRGLNKIHEAA